MRGQVADKDPQKQPGARVGNPAHSIGCHGGCGYATTSRPPRGSRVQGWGAQVPYLGLVVVNQVHHLLHHELTGLAQEVRAHLDRCLLRGDRAPSGQHLHALALLPHRTDRAGAQPTECKMSAASASSHHPHSSFCSDLSSSVLTRPPSLGLLPYLKKGAGAPTSGCPGLSALGPGGDSLTACKDGSRPCGASAIYLQGAGSTADRQSTEYASSGTVLRLHSRVWSE